MALRVGVDELQDLELVLGAELTAARSLEDLGVRC
jgi:hypothetical protein